MKNIKEYLLNEASVEKGIGYTMQPVLKRMPVVNAKGYQYLKIDIKNHPGEDAVKFVTIDLKPFDLAAVRNGDDDGSFDEMLTAIGIMDWWTTGEEIEGLRPGESYLDPYGYMWVCIAK